MTAIGADPADMELVDSRLRGNDPLDGFSSFEFRFSSFGSYS
jgi:hypothetical protein